MKLKENLILDSLEVRNWLCMSLIMNAFNSTEWSDENDEHNGIHYDKLKSLISHLNLTEEQFKNNLDIMVKSNLLVLNHYQTYYNSHILMVVVEYNDMTVEEYLSI